MIGIVVAAHSSLSQLFQFGINMNTMILSAGNNIHYIKPRGLRCVGWPPHATLYLPSLAEATMLRTYLYSHGAHLWNYPTLEKLLGTRRSLVSTNKAFVRKCRVVPMSTHHKSTNSFLAL